jgi:hypothetical protein
MKKESRGAIRGSPFSFACPNEPEGGSRGLERHRLYQSALSKPGIVSGFCQILRSPVEKT